MVYEIKPEMVSRIENDFKYHQPINDQQERYVEVREAAKKFAYIICKYSPPSREQSVALTQLDIVVMQANAAIARNEK